MPAAELDKKLPGSDTAQVAKRPADSAKIDVSLNPNKNLFFSTKKKHISIIFILKHTQSANFTKL